MNFMTLTLLGASWGLFGLRLGYAIWNGRLRAVLSRRIWIQVFLCLLAFTLFGEEAERILDAVFLGKPITLLVKSVALLCMAQLYYQTLLSIDPSVEQYPYLRRLGFGTALVLTLVFALYCLSPWMPLYDFRLITIAFRDAVMCIFIAVSFLPSSWTFWKQERIGSMKLKHTASMVCCASYVVASMGSIGAGLLILTGRPDSVNTLIQTFRPAMYLAATSFLLMLMPQRGLRVFGYSARLLTYWRLRRVENRIRQLGDIQSSKLQASWIMLDPEQLELAIYRSLIFVLDYHPFIRSISEGETLYTAIQRLVRSQKAYSDLVDEITKLI